MKDYQILLNVAIEAAIRAGEKTLEFYNKEQDVLVKDDNSPLTLADLESNRVINDYLKPTGIPVLSEESKKEPFTIRKECERYWLVDPLDGTKEFINKSAEYTINIALIEKNVPVMGIVFLPVFGVLYYGWKGSGSYKINLEGIDSIDILRKKSIVLPVESQTLDNLTIIVSRSHMSDKTPALIESLRKKVKKSALDFYGSSLKFCKVAEGSAGIYPRISTTMEWDIAAGHAIAVFAGCRIVNITDKSPLVYNKEDLRNPGFILYNTLFEKLVNDSI